MKIKILSDIHLEFGIRNFNISDCDLVILAGDIHIGLKGLEWISHLIKDIPVIYVLGNHEYYKNAYPKLLLNLKTAALGSNIHVLENESISVNEITFHGCTLWTDFELFGDPLLTGIECEQKMNDYHQIRKSPSYSKLKAIDTLAMHRISKNWLQKSLKESKTEKNVVITHHAPSIKSIAPKYRNDIVSAAFASSLDDYILETKPNLWIHGHVHNAFDYFIGSTRVVCNPTGYPNERVGNFQPELLIELGS